MRGRSGGAAADLLAGSPAKVALARAPDVALALEEPGGQPAGKAGSMADDSSQPDSDAASGVGWRQRLELGMSCLQRMPSYSLFAVCHKKGLGRTPPATPPTSPPLQLDSGMSEGDDDGADFSRLKRFKKVWTAGQGRHSSCWLGGQSAGCLIAVP